MRAVGSKHWESGGAGAEALGRAVMEACDEANAAGRPSEPPALYDMNAPIEVRGG